MNNIYTITIENNKNNDICELYNDVNEIISFYDCIVKPIKFKGQRIKMKDFLDLTLEEFVKKYFKI